MSVADEKLLKPTKPDIQYFPTILAVVTLGLICYYAGQAGGAKKVVAVLIGAFAGFTLYHASYGFTSAWRKVFVDGRGAGIRSQFILILIVCAISFPLIAYGKHIPLPESIFGEGATLRTGAFVAPVGVGMMIGAFLFGMGMQFGLGCGSGVLFVAGGGSVRMLITISAFIIGSFLGSMHFGWWASLPRFKPWSMVTHMGPFLAYITVAIILLLIAAFTIYRERKIYGSLQKSEKTQSFLRGTWSPMAGAYGLAIVSILTLLVIGRPWGITEAYAVWGAKIANSLGVDVYAYDYWAGGRRYSVEKSVFHHTTSVMNFGIFMGAMLAGGLASKWRPVFKLSKTQIGTAILGGLLMGYGARMAYGCNIGAYLGGLLSGSMHGWAWMLAAFLGSSLAILIKRRCGI